jgi:5-methylcytosine-specific restriction endonuclease McrA
MNKINFIEPDTDNWRDWCEQCRQEQEAHNRSIESGNRPDPKASVYKGEDYNIKKEVYLNPEGSFHGKCAYCGKKIFGTQYGDIDHYRPKKAVSDANFNDIIGHPGYYWLCYDWKNLLPSCILCNRKSSPFDHVIIGKHTRFPVRSFRATRPGEESREEPLLINPLLEDPCDHIEVDATGILYARESSDRGQACIDIFGLNYRDLPNERKERYNSIRQKMGVILLGLAQGGAAQAEALQMLRDMQDIKNGHGEFTAVAIKAMRDAIENSKLAEGIING